jgi:hypothetical protein
LWRFCAGRAVLVQLKEESPDNAEFAKDLAVFNRDIAKLEQAKGAEQGTAQPGQDAEGH